jgi:hypothetical protein
MLLIAHVVQFVALGTWGQLMYRYIGCAGSPAATSTSLITDEPLLASPSRWWPIKRGRLVQRKNFKSFSKESKTTREKEAVILHYDWNCPMGTVWPSFLVHSDSLANRTSPLFLWEGITNVLCSVILGSNPKLSCCVKNSLQHFTVFDRVFPKWKSVQMCHIEKWEKELHTRILYWGSPVCRVRNCLWFPRCTPTALAGSEGCFRNSSLYKDVISKYISLSWQFSPSEQCFMCVEFPQWHDFPTAGQDVRVNYSWHLRKE